MFKFSKEQRIFQISSIRIGGQPGQLPTVMIGSIFYHRHKIMRDERTGEFDKVEAERLLRLEEETSKKIGNPRIVDVCASYPEAIGKLIDFVAKTTDGPFAIDGAGVQAKIAGAKYVGESGLADRVVYNSISPNTEDSEISAIRDARIKSAILLTLNTRSPTIAGRLQVLDGLIATAKKAGIQNMLVDTANLDIPDPGLVSKAIYLVKEKYGLPAGAGTHNAVSMWRQRRKLQPTEHLLANSVANIFPIMLGADFALYGPVEGASTAYFCCGLADAYVAYSMRREYGLEQLTKEHPVLKIFRG